MGFGLCAFGYICLICSSIGLDTIGYIIMAVSCKKLTRVQSGYKKAMIAAILLIPVGLFNLAIFTDTVLHNFNYNLLFIGEDIEAWKFTEELMNGWYLLFILLFHYRFYRSSFILAVNGSGTKLASRIKRVMTFTLGFYVIFGIVNAVMPGTKYAMLLSLANFIVKFVNFLSIYSCYALFAFKRTGENNDANEKDSA